MVPISGSRSNLDAGWGCHVAGFVAKSAQAGTRGKAVDIELPEGWLSGARRVDSPHQDARPPGVGLDLVVIHGISLPPGQYGGDAVEALFQGGSIRGRIPISKRLQTCAYPRIC